MTYDKFPPNSIMSHDLFISEMNKALTSLPYYRKGMLVCADESGYWLEIDGMKDFENQDVLSAARKLVLGE